MTSRPSRTLPMVVLAAAAIAAGCAPSTNNSSNSTSKFRGDARLAAQAIEDLQSAANDNADTRICTEILSRAFAGRLAQGGRNCAETVDQAVRDADSIDMTVQQVSVNGDQATARVKLETGKTDRTATFRLVRENNRWRIAGF